jgi:hypothetical protein
MTETLTRRRALGALALAAAACQPSVRAAVTLKLALAKSAPADASVYIDEEYVGPLAYVAAHGVRLPVGEHRISVLKEGWFPWDRLVVADRQPIALDVEMVPIPD